MPQKTKKILIVDDDAFARKLLKGILKDQHFDIFEASNGSQAVKMTRDIIPDLIVMDVIMPEKDDNVITSKMTDHAFSSLPDYLVMDISIPGGNGIEAAKTIKTDFPQIPIVGMSGADSAAKTTLGAQDYLEILKMVGAEQTILKPVGKDVFLDVVKSVLGKESLNFKAEIIENTEEVYQKPQEPAVPLPPSSKTIPADMKRLLTREQIASIVKMEEFGWKLLFIRRSDFAKIIVLMESPSGEHTGLIEADGNLNTSHDVRLRNSENSRH